MTLYLLQYTTILGCGDPYYTYEEYTVIGIYNDIEKLKEQFIKSCKELNNIDVPDIEEKVQKWSSMESNGLGIEYGLSPHSLSVQKYILNNDPSTLYEPGGEMFKHAEEEITKLLKNN